MEYTIDLTYEQATAFEQGWQDHKPNRGPRYEASYVIADAIRANPPKPPRMDEPGCRLQVVASTPEKAARRGFLRLPYRCSNAQAWWVDGSGCYRRWDELIDPQPYESDEG